MSLNAFFDGGFSFSGSSGVAKIVSVIATPEITKHTTKMNCS